MVAFPRTQGLTGSVPLFGGALAGAAAAIGLAAMPTAMLESLVWSSGIAALVPAAEPPLGVTARAVLALAAGGMAAAVMWSALYLLFGPGGYLRAETKQGANQGATPAVRRADAHPDAPPRKPMSAADLGTPLMEVVAVPEARQSVVEAIAPVERTLPADLDTPLASFAADAIPAANARPIAPAVTLEPGERMASFELTPKVRFGNAAPAADLRPEPTVRPSLEHLIRRLEQGAQRRTAHS